MLSVRLRFQQWRALCSAVSGKPNLDNSTDFLSSVPHRKHPGILHMNIVHLPKEAVDAARSIMKNCSIRQEQVSSLKNYLWSRKCPVEDSDLRLKASQLEDEFKERLQNESEMDPVDREEKIKNQVLNALRKSTYNWQPLNYSQHIGLVYLAARFDGGYAAVTRALYEINKRVPDFKPLTLMDFGSGVGTVIWAAHALWGNSVKEYMCVDTSASMNNLSEMILRGGSETSRMHIHGVYFRQFLPVSPKVQYDLVISAFSLNELPNFAARQKTIQALWRKTGGFLVLVENGTREGHRLLMEARDIVLRCPHQLECPKLSENSKVPCNFVQKYQSFPLSWNSQQQWEKFSFLILSRGIVGGDDKHWPRVIGDVLLRPRHVHCHTCGSDGKLHHDVITSNRHGKDLYRCARICKLGDRLPAIISYPDSDPDAPGNKGKNDS
ncbi:ribosome assembly protein METTL17, mitochondrial isoform X2 [Hyperolius riggenbachi]|uniref:ribosome assembly protein METTL17, mitochondrial isoform X2 n=1 Tax=Hyperolius riggenbachi TaxID=752182 RepID=UPI0035A3D1EB